MTKARDQRVSSGRKLSARYSKTLTKLNPKKLKPVWTAIPSVDLIKRVYGLTLKSKF